mmetsp:Transcript_9561/g.11446  ORF Transcript_9561/g.11446 Transcript_9561/m.11446 type:complete len:107 (+) Transcript_9561:48-368(+)|eukprot:CAMPEP_0195274816 /NCGR_PEP_ID=MMETSP0706-20130129/17414_1 /TAXON_ID=33640 /ORGANISM="Asterionellopsis glacialis, Strain CCMP134" /LENGTH=106 /DNA_ID=CAMNT_0040331837 /DNA_START=53 /DNA_END=373 /DNA_ORIENTATION=+
MKFLTSLLVASASLTSVSAFSSSSMFGVSRPSTTKAYLTPDPEFLSQLASQGEDAVRMIFLQCNDMECAQISGVKDAEGWSFQGGLDTDWKQTTTRVVSKAMVDTE